MPLGRTCCLAFGGAPSPVKSGVGVLFPVPEEGTGWAAQGATSELLLES